MTSKQMYLIVFFTTIVSFGIGLYLYPTSPHMFASHWDINGNVNGYISKFWGLFLLPILMVGISGLLFWLPKIDPFKANVALFQKQYHSIITGIVLFLFYVHLLTLVWNLGYRFEIERMIVPPLALLWYLLGVSLPKMKQNWFMGIRTPWTLESVRVWDETHAFSGKLFQYCAGIALIGLFFPPYTFWFVIIPVIFSSFGAIFYSYILYKKYEKDTSTTVR